METRIVDITTTFNDIPHLATTLWYSGCNLNCQGCQNTILEHFKVGFDTEKLEKELKKRRKMTEWIVHLGGNPLDSLDSLLYTANLAKELGFKQFLYSGYTYDEFTNMFDSKTHEEILNTIDFIKTGRYDMNFLKTNCKKDGINYFFESLNQEVYRSQKVNWEKVYAFDFKINDIYGNFLI